MKEQKFFPYYDEASDKIRGCRVGSIWWWHERGHQLQNRSGWLGIFQCFQMFLLLWILADIIIKTKNVFAGILFILVTFLIAIPEMQAWLFAIKNFKRSI